MLKAGVISAVWRLEAGLIGKQAFSGNKWSRPHRTAVIAVRIAVFLAFYGFAAHAWSRQASLSAPGAAIDVALPNAPEAQASPAPRAPVPSSPGSIHGVVVDRDGTVCEGARVNLTQSGPAASAVRSTISGSDGRFVFNNVPAGGFKLAVSSGGFVTDVIAGVLHPGESYEAPPVSLLVTAAQSEVRVSASQDEIGLEQFKEEEEQRVLGIIPNFYVSYAPDAPPLTSRQKFNLAWKSSIDPITLLATGFSAGIEQADNSYKGYGQGAQGYSKRYAANYADNFIGTMIGGAILPSLLKQDPRYFYKGTGSTRSRFFYAISMTVVCKGDNGHWQPNYSGLSAGLAAGGISNLYYPAADRNGMSLTFENTGLGIAGGAIENLFQEFVVRKFTPRLPGFIKQTP
jgi:hypothetical protein